MPYETEESQFLAILLVSGDYDDYLLSNTWPALSWVGRWEKESHVFFFFFFFLENEFSVIQSFFFLLQTVLKSHLSLQRYISSLLFQVTHVDILIASISEHSQRPKTPFSHLTVQWTNAHKRKKNRWSVLFITEVKRVKLPSLRENLQSVWHCKWRINHCPTRPHKSHFSYDILSEVWDSQSAAKNSYRLLKFIVTLRLHLLV